MTRAKVFGCILSSVLLVTLVAGCTGTGDRKSPAGDNGNETNDVGDMQMDADPSNPDSGRDILPDGEESEDSQSSDGTSGDTESMEDTGPVEIPGPARCIRECSDASDCTEGGGTADDWICTGGLCKADMCDVRSDCPPTAWRNKGCSAGSCGTGRICVNHNDSTWCATRPSDGVCFLGSPVEKTSADGSTVSVCLQEADCKWNRCVPAGLSCEDENIECSAGGSCNDNGVCACSAGDCTDGFTCWTG